MSTIAGELALVRVRARALADKRIRAMERRLRDEGADDRFILTRTRVEAAARSRRHMAEMQAFPQHVHLANQETS